MGKNSVDLICSVGELTGIFEKSQSLHQFLQQVVSVVAWHMRAAVCSVYLIDRRTDELVLTANQGLDPSAVGHLRLKQGEGIVGTSVWDLRPIREGHVRRNPHFRLIPTIGEERYESFLVVPILRGSQRIGALVVEDPQPDYFDANDEKALRAIAAQLASAIENANLLLSLHDPAKVAPDARGPMPAGQQFMRGISCSSGIAYGLAVILTVAPNEVLHHPPETAADGAAVDFQEALKRTEQQIRQLQIDMEAKLADVAALIFSSHLLILKDEQFSGAMQDSLAHGTPAATAVEEVVDRFVHLFSTSSNPVLRQKTLDVMDLGRRLLRNLRGGADETADYRGNVVIASDLLPSDILKLSAQQAEGLVVIGGGATSHLSVLSRSLNLPMIVVGDERLASLPEQTPLLVDADQGTVYINPTEDILARYRDLKTAIAEAEQTAADMSEETHTLDGVRIKLMANINLISDVPVALRLKSEGVGLYRSEFPFIVRNDFPSEEEQYRIYSRIVREMQGREVTFRTLDIGGDKALSYFPLVSEANPFLGLRAIRFSLRYRQFFTPQLRALLRAGAEGPTRIMFPMISSLEDFLTARDVVYECMTALSNEGLACTQKPSLGIMVELPAAVEVMEDLAKEVDFVSIGSNDLVQYVLAVDRTNERVADLYQPHHPAVLRVLHRVALAALRFERPISICGEMATNPKIVPFLLGIGVHTLSLDPRHIPAVRQAVSAIRLTDAEALAARAVRLSRVRDVEELLGLVNTASGEPA